MMNKIKWAVIGSGGIARRRTIPEGIMPASNAELVGVYDVNQEANNEVARACGAAAATSVEDLLRAEAEAVYIATPAYLHYDHVRAAAKAGKHVLCEKPLGLTLSEAQDMIEICDKHNVRLGTAFMMRFQSQHQAALQLIRAGKLGTLVYGRAQLSCWYPQIEGAWRQDPALGGGGSLVDLGGHCIDLLEMFFGKVVKLSCFINNQVHTYKSEDSAVVQLVFQSGAIATVDAFFCIPDNSSRNRLELYGSSGSIIAEHTLGQGAQGIMKAYLEQKDIGYDAGQARKADEAVDINPVPVSTYQAEIEEFSTALLEQRPPRNDGYAGYVSQLIIEACYESARKGMAVTVER